MDLQKTEHTGTGVALHIDQYALSRIETAAAAGVRQELSSRIDKLIDSTIADVVDAKLSEVVGNLAEDAILSYLTKPRPRTNAYGEPIGGSEITIAEQIPQKVEKWMNELVNSRGELDSYHSKGSLKRIDFIVGKFVRDELDIATKAAASQVSEQAKKVVATHVGRFVAEQMIPQIEVNGVSRG